MMNKKKRIDESRMVRNGQAANKFPETETALLLSRYAKVEIAGMANDYYFNRLEFERFCEQLCKEQREICLRISKMHSETENRSHLIANAPAPMFL